MRLLLDTHVLIGALNKPIRLDAATHTLLDLCIMITKIASFLLLERP